MDENINLVKEGWNDSLKKSPCIGCGFCCFKGKCVPGHILYPSTEICPALKWNENDKRYICQIMTIPGKIGEEFKKEMCAGIGCCMNLNGWRKEVKKREQITEAKVKELFNPIFKLFLKHLGNQNLNGIVEKLVDELKKDEYCSEEEANKIGDLILLYLETFVPPYSKKL